MITAMAFAVIILFLWAVWLSMKARQWRRMAIDAGDRAHRIANEALRGAPASTITDSHGVRLWHVRIDGEDLLFSDSEVEAARGRMLLRLKSPRT